MKKSKGFTLVELLAVIVILAVLVLAATPAVSNIMQKSQKNSLKSEVVSLAKTMSTVYTNKINDTAQVDVTGTPTATSTKVYTAKSIKIKNTSSTATFRYVCMGLDKLVSENYVTKSFAGKYGGYIQIWVNEASGEQYVYVNLFNGSYYVQGYEDEISKNSYEVTSISGADGTIVKTPSLDDFKCPTSAAMPKEGTVPKKA